MLPRHLFSSVPQTTQNPLSGAALDEQPLSALARLHITPDHSLTTALHALARIAQSTLAVDRFSVWLSTDDRRAVRQFLLCGEIDTTSSAGTILHTNDFPSYFAALANHRTLAIESIQDPAVRELAGAYLVPLHIGAMLDAALFRAGVAVGIVCHEHIGASRRWSEAEHAFAAAVADTASRLFEESARITSEHSLELYRDQLLSLTRLDALGRMAAGVAHDVNNLLMVVAANVELLDSTAQAEDEHETLRTIRNAVTAGRSLTDELMQLGRRAAAPPTVHRPESLVAEVLRLGQSALGHRHAIEFVARAPVSRVFVDAAQLSRVLLNLILNAGDAMPDGGTIHVDVEERDVNREGVVRRFVSISVRDAGVGMDAETQLHMFDPFFTTKGHGNGLGLAIAHQIVIRAGGFFEVHSAKGAGTTVSVMLPPVE